MKGRLVLLFIAGLLVAVLASPAGATSKPGSFSPATPMNRARSFFVATELRNGDVLVAGGFDGTADPPVFPDAEIYHWHTGTWTTTAPMLEARSAPVSVRLNDGRVMVIGGFDLFFGSLASVEIYDPKTATWSSTGSLNEARGEDFTAVLVSGGRVLVAGGFASGFVPLSSAEIWDPKTGQWTVTASMEEARAEFTTTELKDGRVLVAGGFSSEEEGPLASAEIFDPHTETWTETGSMSTGRADQAAVLLHNGRVLVAGGEISEEEPRLSSAEIFDPHTGTWSSTGDLTTARSEAEFAAVLLRDGRVLIAGGFVDNEQPLDNADVYDPRSGTFSAAGPMSDARAGNSAILLRGNRGVLVMGGLDVPPAATASADIFH